MARSTKTIKIHRFQITNTRHAEILFQMTDPGIPDNVLFDRTNGGLRVASRNASEDPAVSAHVVVDLRDKHDKMRVYPACIENIDYLPRSLIIQYFNEWMAEKLVRQIVRKGETEPKRYQPSLEFVAPATQTIQGALEKGGILRGVKWVEDTVSETTFGDAAFPVQKRTDVSLTVKGRPTKDAAKKILSDVWDQAIGKKPKVIKVTIEDGNERVKTIGIDPSRSNVLSNVFIPQAHFDGFSRPLAMCEGEIRTDLVAKMKSALVK